MSQPVLEMRGICKSFNAVPVLQDVDFTLRKGEIMALMGGNGAGKSTLMKILTGVYRADQGEIRIEGRPVNIEAPSDSRAHGISMIFQEFSLIPTLTVAQNIFLTREPMKRGFIDEKACSRQAAEMLAGMGIHDLNPEEFVGNLGVGYWQMTEIAKALSQSAKILILDEPTSSLTRSETDKLFELMRRLKTQGISMVYISHRMEEIFTICDRITVLRDGKQVLVTNISDTSMNEIIEIMIGRKAGNAMEWKKREVDRSSDPILELEEVCSGRRVQGVSLRLYPGEILGIAGLLGSGRTELLQSIFGIRPIDGGTVKLRGQPVNIRTPKQAINAGMALIPEDRRKQGLVLDHSVRDNMLLPTLHRWISKGFVNDRRGKDAVAAYIGELAIKTDHMDKTIRFLSGGNQQKVVMAKWLMSQPDILLLDEPTVGIDISSKMEIMETIRRLADEGKAVLFVSSELAELLAISDRVLILKKGKSINMLHRHEIESEEVLHHAIQ